MMNPLLYNYRAHINMSTSCRLQIVINLSLRLCVVKSRNRQLQGYKELGNMLMSGLARTPLHPYIVGKLTSRQTRLLLYA
jgi:hypothetical protein